jgi:hypothetical protein
MAIALGQLMPIEVGYTVVYATDIGTGEKGELWLAGGVTTDSGCLEHQM